MADHVDESRPVDDSISPHEFPRWFRRSLYLLCLAAAVVVLVAPEWLIDVFDSEQAPARIMAAVAFLSSAMALGNLPRGSVE